MHLWSVGVDANALGLAMSSAASCRRHGEPVAHGAAHARESSKGAKTNDGEGLTRLSAALSVSRPFLAQHLVASPQQPSRIAHQHAKPRLQWHGQ